MAWGVKERWLQGPVPGVGRWAPAEAVPPAGTGRSGPSPALAPWLGRRQAAATPAAGLGGPAEGRRGRVGRAACTPAARGQRFGSCSRRLPGLRPTAPARPSAGGAERSSRAPRSERREPGRAGRGGGARGGGGGSRGGSRDAGPRPSPPSGPEGQGAWTRARRSGTMTPARLVVALILGALPEVVSSDPVLRYPLRHRHRHPPFPSPQFAYYLPTPRRPRRTPLSPPARPPRPAPAPRAQSPLALHAGQATRPGPGGCPAGRPWVNVTDFGAPCLRWADVPPLLERSPPAGWAPLRGQRHNLCRSPDGAGRPWCFYRNARGRGDWGYCDCGHGERPRGGGTGSGRGCGRARGCAARRCAARYSQVLGDLGVNFPSEALRVKGVGGDGFYARCCALGAWTWSRLWTPCVGARAPGGCAFSR